jgi:hypothetical protein
MEKGQLVDIFDDNDNVVGGGLYIDIDHVVTCAHVVNTALGRVGNFQVPVNSVIKVNFSFDEKCNESFVCIVKEWHYKENEKRKTDFAVLKIVHSCNYELLNERSSTCIIKTSNDYWGNDSRLYGRPEGVKGDWVQANLLDYDGDGLLKIHLKAPIGKGFSGYPVYCSTTKGYVGLIWGGRDGFPDTAYAIMFDKILPIIPSLNAYSSRIAKSTTLGPLCNIVRRENYFRTIDDSLERFDICIVVAASGFGKSTLCDTYMREYIGGKKSFFQRLDTQRVDLTGFSGVFYLDDYSDNNLMKNVLNESVPFKILLSCKSPTVASDILKKKGLYPWHNQIIVTLNGFSLVEAKELLLSYGCLDELMEVEIENFVNFTKGCPMALKGLVKLLHEGQLNSSNFLSNQELDAEKSFQFILNEYLKIHEATKKILGVLCNVPFIGMNASALASLLGISRNEVDNTIKELIELGYVLEYQKNKRYFKECLLVPHDLLKKAFSNYFEESKEMKQAYRKYNFDYFNYIISQSIDDADIISRVDAFVCGIRGTFKIMWDNDHYTKEEFRITSDSTITWDKYSPELQNKVRYQVSEQDRFFENFSKVKDRAYNLFPTDLNDNIIEVVVEYFKGSISLADCSELIAIAQAFARFPVNKILGDTIWTGIQNYDDWAVGCCIHAAVRHSKNQSRIINSARVNELKYWLTEKSQHDRGADFDLTAAVGGLIYLDEAEFVFESLTSAEYGYKKTITALSDLPMLVHLASNQDIDRLKRFYSIVCKRISRNAALHMVCHYVKQKTDLELNVDLCYQQNIMIDKDFSITVAKSLFNEDFFSFALENGSPNASNL